MNIYKTISFNLLILGLFVLLIEIFLGAIIFVRRRANIGGEKNYKLQYQISGTTGHKHFFKKSIMETGYDYRTLDFSKKSYLECDSKNCETNNILTLGSSTTDPFGLKYSGKGGTWPELFGSKLSKSTKSNINIINYGQGAFTTSQELISLIKAKSLHDIDIAISLNGMTDYYFVRNIKFLNDQISEFESDMLIKSYNKNNSTIFFNNSRFQKCNLFCIYIDLKYKSNITKALDFINTKKLLAQRRKLNNQNLKNINKKNYEEKVYKRVADIYERNLNDMNNIAKTNNIKYLAFLQPAMLVKDLTKFESDSEELTIYDYLHKNYPNEDKLVKLRLSNMPEYLYAISKLYKELKTKCDQLSFCYDLTDFDSSKESKLFNDPRHFNKMGNDIISQEIMNVVKAKFDN